MAAAREVAFELERFEWVGEDQLEVVGRWRGVSGRRLARPVLYVEAGGRRRRLAAMPGGRPPAGEGQLWKAVFGWSYGSDTVSAAELEVARSIVVDLPPPRTKRRVPGATSPSADIEQRRLQEEVDALKAQLAELTAAREAAAKEAAEALRAAEERAAKAEAAAAEAASAAPTAAVEPPDESPQDTVPAAEHERVVAELAARDESPPDTVPAAEHERVVAELAARDESPQDTVPAAEHERVVAELSARDESPQDTVPAAEHERVVAELAARDESPQDTVPAAEHERVVAELSALKAQQAATVDDQLAALRAQNGELRHELGEAMDAQERLAEELRVARETQMEGNSAREQLMSEVAQMRADLKARDEALERARRELEAAGQEAERRLAAERAEIAHVRAKLAEAREEAERGLAAEAEETERLRTELGTAREEAERTLAMEREETARLREELSEHTSAEGETTDGSGRRMYESIARELERERATVRELRRELDDQRAQRAEKRRTFSTGATNGVTTSQEAPVAQTPAGRSGRAAAAMAARADAAERSPIRRAEAARAAAAQRVPEHHHSPAGVWAVRATAMVLVAVLLVALFVIITSLA